MKKIINGRVYDTEKAHRLGYNGGGDGFHSWHEELYQKRTGEFFLYGEGGPATKYAYYVDANNAWSGGNKIIPMTVETAMEWAEENLTAEEYEQIFGLPDEDAEPVTLCIQLPADLTAKLREGASKSDSPLGKYITSLLKTAIK